MDQFWQFWAKVAFATAAYFAPVQDVFLILLAFVGVDLVTGIIASRTRRIPPSSRRMRKSVVKLISYMTAILLAFLLEKLAQIDWIVPHRAVAALLCTVEFVSVLENLAVITENRLFLWIIQLIRGRAGNDKVIKDIIDEKNDIFHTGAAAGRWMSDRKDTRERPGNETNE